MTLYNAFAAATEQFVAQPFLRAPKIATSAYADHAIEYSYAAAKQAVDRLRAGYRASDIAAGDRVAVAFDSRLDVYLHLLAVNALGASLVPLNMAASDEELRFLIGHSQARVITGADEHLDRLSA